MIAPQPRRSAIVSNSGMMFICRRGASPGRSSPASLSSSATSSMSLTPLVLEMM